MDYRNLSHELRLSRERLKTIPRGTAEYLAELSWCELLDSTLRGKDSSVGLYYGPNGNYQRPKRSPWPYILLGVAFIIAIILSNL